MGSRLNRRPASLRRVLASLVCLALITVAASRGGPPAAAHATPQAQPATLDLGDGTRLAVVADLQGTSIPERIFMFRESNRRQRDTLMAHLVRQAPEALVVIGDLVSNPRSRSQWSHYHGLLAPLTTRTPPVPVLPALGNHDYWCRFPGLEPCDTSVVIPEIATHYPWLRTPAPTHYRARFGELGLIVLDSERLGSNGSAQRLYLLESLRHFRATGTRGVLVFTHRPAYTNSSDVDADPRVLMYVASTLESFRQNEWDVPMALLSGHAHGYERFKPDRVHYIVSAGGGGPRQRLRSPPLATSPTDLYSARGGRECVRERRKRPLNYLIVEPSDDGIWVEVFGLCRKQAAPWTVFRVERFVID